MSLHTVLSTVSLYNTIITSYQLLSLTNLTDVFPTSAQPDKWLSLQQTLPLSKLVYLDVGPFHQFLRLEFSIPESCFTFLLRDKSKCRECLTRLSSKIHRGIFGARVLVRWCKTMRKPLGERESILLMKQQTRYMYNRMCLPGVQFWSTTDPSLIFCVNVKISLPGGHICCVQSSASLFSWHHMVFSTCVQLTEKDVVLVLFGRGTLHPHRN